jgi:hypothetical protein
MNLSRRDALRAGGGLIAGGLAGCVERRVTRRETNVESSTTWALSPTTGNELDGDPFAAYVDDMETEFGDSGVWGESDPLDGSFETAYAQRLPIVREASGQPGGDEPTLEPGEVDRGASSFPVVDAAVALYDDGDDTVRHWLWAAIDVRAETFAGDAPATILSAGVSLRNGATTETAAVSTANGSATVEFPDESVGRFPLRGVENAVGTGDRTGEDGYYVVEWTGEADGVQSINGVCEVDRDGDYDVAWSVGGGYRRVQRL